MSAARSELGALGLAAGVFAVATGLWLFAAPQLLMVPAGEGSEALSMAALEIAAGLIIAGLLTQGLIRPAFLRLARGRGRRPVVAEVVESWLERDDLGPGGRTSHHLAVALRFELDGRAREMQLRVGAGQLGESAVERAREGWPAGRSVEIRVDPEAPEELSLGGSSAPLVATLGAGLLALAAPAWVLACGFTALLGD